MLYFEESADNLEDPSLLETLYWQYKKAHAFSNDETRLFWAKLQNTVQKLPWEQQEEILGFANLFAESKESLAFLSGMRYGGKLMSEMQEKKDTSV